MFNKKGQVVITDLMVSIFIFIFIVLLIFSLWTFHNVRLQDNLNFEDMQTKAFQISNVLVKSQGDPSNWENNHSTVSVIGLAQDDRILSEAKMNNLTDMSYGNVSRLLKLGKYNMSLNISDLSGNTLASFGEYKEGETVVEIRRYVLYGETKSIMALRIWE